MSPWAPWSAEAFARARASGKPVLATVGPLPDAALKAVEAEIAERFVAVVADPDSRPDAAARIGRGHAVVLTPDGRRRGVLPLPAPDLAATLARMAAEAEAAAAGRPSAPEHSWTGAVREKALPEPPSPALVDGVFKALPEMKEPTEDALEALLYAASERGDAASREALERALGAMLDAEWDAPRGAFGPGLQSPLVLHARRARLLWDAHALTGAPRWREAAADATRFLTRVLFDARAGAFRRAPESPVHPADGNALAVLALLRAAAFGADKAWETGERALAFLQTRLYDPLLGLVHAAGGEEEAVHGLLGDAAWTALASTEAYLATGDKRHREFADALLRFLFQELWEREGGGFLDRVPRPDDPAILREPRLDPALNAVSLEVCWRLHHLKGNMNYRRWLDWGLRGAWPAAAGDPARLAGLARVADMQGRGRADFELIGRLGEPKAMGLLAALRRQALPRALVSFVDPDDQDYILAHKLTADSYPRLFGCGADLRRLADAAAPEGVAAVVAAVRAAEAA